MGVLEGTNVVKVRESTRTGLLANGSSGRWEIAVDETLTKKVRWFLHIEGPPVDFYFGIPSLGIIDSLIAHLTAVPVSTVSASHDEGLLVGGNKRVPVRLVRDIEFADRAFLVVGSSSPPTVRYTIAGPDFISLIEALRQVKEDLES